MRVFTTLLLALVLAGCATSPSQPSTSTTSTIASTSPPVSATTTSTPAGVPPQGDIIIKDFSFSPASYDESLGETVKWANQDGVAHTVTADHGEFDSGTLAAGSVYSFPTTSAGTIPYHCKIHPSMKGTLHVVNATPATTSTTTSTTTTTPPGGTTSPTPVTITIQGFAFHPATLSVPTGTRVTWQNADTSGHTATSDTGAFGSTTLREGDAYSFTFSTPGTYAFHCAIHSSMTGTVTVAS